MLQVTQLQLKVFVAYVFKDNFLYMLFDLLEMKTKFQYKFQLIQLPISNGYSYGK